ncbi:MAG: HPr family phosphocarrier protein [Proteobacteria bacterium]|nr:HPr family phosphocarrier protein [Pseudomonadota bacterium]
MRRTHLTIVNPLGLHARAASKLVDLAKNYASNISLRSAEGIEADAKRIMNLLLLGAPVGSAVELQVEGEDEGAAFDALTHLIEAGFHEMDDT